MRTTLLSALLACPALAFAAGPNLVTNGSFEDTALGAGSWQTFVGTQVNGWTAAPQIEVRNNVAGAAEDGQNYVELDADYNSSMYQVLNTVAGTTYDLSFYYSNRTDTNVSTDGLSYSVGAGNVSLPVLASNSTGDNVWSLYSTTFTATSSSTTLTFSAIGTSDSYGSSLDNVTVTPVPEPQTYALMLAGLAAVGFVARRRSRN